MTEDELPTAPATETASDQADPRTWRDRLPSGRTAVAAGAIVAGLAIGGAGFGAGYAVADSGADDATLTQTTGTDRGDRQMPGDRGSMGGTGGQLNGQVPGGPLGGTTEGDGSIGQAPDFDGDGQPDTEGDTTQNS